MHGMLREDFLLGGEYDSGILFINLFTILFIRKSTHTDDDQDDQERVQTGVGVSVSCFHGTNSFVRMIS